MKLSFLHIPESKLRRSSSVAFYSCLLFLLAAVLSSCSKNSFDPRNFYPKELMVWHECAYEEVGYDSLMISQSLIGTWIRKYQICVFSETVSGEILNTLYITLKTDQTGEVYRTRGQTPTQIQWSVVRALKGNYVLSVSPSVAELNGNFFFCQDHFFTQQSFIDLCDNYFVRVN